MIGVRSDSVWPMGEADMQNNSIPTVFYGTGAFTKILGNTVQCDCVQLMDMPENNRLRYTGTSRKMFHGACTVSLYSSIANQQLDLRLYKNGIAMENSTVKIECITPNSYVSTALHLFLELDPNEYLELWAANNSSGASIIVVTMNLFLMGM